VSSEKVSPVKALFSLSSLFLIVLVGLVVKTPGGEDRAVVALQASPVAAVETFAVTGLVEIPSEFSVADLQSLPVETIEATAEVEGVAETHTYTGVLLWDVLAGAKPLSDPDVNGDSLRKYVVLTANDGYEVVITLGEIDPQFSGQPYLLAWEEDGVALTGAKGPVELVTPGDKTSGRFIWGIDTIEVRDVDSPPRG
jgi:DMSO/TMAO reductase YedYZ molybdopterin-dependent catalytic subunit